MHMRSGGGKIKQLEYAWNFRAVDLLPIRRIEGVYIFHLILFNEFTMSAFYYNFEEQSAAVEMLFIFIYRQVVLLPLV